MKRILLLLALFFVFQAQAAQLTCRNMFSRDEASILDLEMSSPESIESLRFELRNQWFSDYLLNLTGDAGPNWQNQPTRTISDLVNPKEKISGKLVRSARSPYKGMNEFKFVLGHYSFRSPYLNTEGEYEARLIINTDLKSAYLILPQAFGSSMSGKNTLKMNCSSL